MATGKVVVDEVLEELAERGSERWAGKKLRVDVGSASIDVLHVREPLLRVRCQPKDLRAGQRALEVRDGQLRRRVMEQAELLVTHDPVVHESVLHLAMQPCSPLKLRARCTVQRRNHRRLRLQHARVPKHLLYVSFS